jgi:plastocyanin
MSRLLSISRRRFFAGAAVLAAIVLSTLPSLAADPTVVTISNFAFTPAMTTVAAGTTVTFKNGDDTIHSVLADDGSFHSPALDSGDEYSFTFAKAGIFSYHCGLHPFMQGQIIVK